MKRLAPFALLLVPALLIAADAPAPDIHKEPNPATQPSAEDLKLLQPGPEHERLKALVGEFDGEYEVFTAPGAEAKRSKGKVVNELVYGGRFIQGHFECDMLGSRVTGQNLIGYDNAKKRYVGTWVNSGSTGIVVAEGAADAAGKVITVEFEEKNDADPAHPYRTQFVTTIIDRDHYRFETVLLAPGIEPFTVARINYSRHNPAR